MRAAVFRSFLRMKEVVVAESSSSSTAERAESAERAARKTCIAYVTVPTREIGLQVSRRSVGTGLAACANMIAGVTSVYRWRGNLEEDSEFLVILKTTQGCVRELEQAVKEIHPSEVPCFFTIPMDHVSGEYESWLIESTRPDQRGKIDKIMTKIKELEHVKINSTDDGSSSPTPPSSNNQ